MIKDKFGFGVVTSDGIYWFNDFSEAFGFYIRNKDNK